MLWNERARFSISNQVALDCLSAIASDPSFSEASCNILLVFDGLTCEDAQFSPSIPSVFCPDFQNFFGAACGCNPIVPAFTIPVETLLPSIPSEAPSLIPTTMSESVSFEPTILSVDTRPNSFELIIQFITDFFRNFFGDDR